MLKSILLKKYFMIYYTAVVVVFHTKSSMIYLNYSATKCFLEFAYLSLLCLYNCSFFKMKDQIISKSFCVSNSLYFHIFHLYHRPKTYFPKFLVTKTWNSFSAKVSRIFELQYYLISYD